MFDPEAIEVALFNLIKTAVTGLGIITVSRKATPPENVPEADQPAVFLIPVGWQTDQEANYGQPRYRIHYVVEVYVRADSNPDFIPQTLMNNVAKNIFAGLLDTKPPGSKQTLGRLVQNAYVNGDTIMQPGILDQQCAMQIPILAETGL